jgi:hypothetical protein
MLVDIDVKSNVEVVARERGKIVYRYENHNIFTDSGRDWLAHLISFQAMPPSGTYVSPCSGENNNYYHPRHNLIRYMGFGMGGTKQVYPAAAFTTPPLSYYQPQSFSQTDTDPSVYSLEIPVAISDNGTAIPPVPDTGPLWLGQISVPTFPSGSAGEIVFQRLITEAEISFPPFDLVPISEVGLFIDDPAGNYTTTKPAPTSPPFNMVAYDQINTLPKTNAIAFEVKWTFRF